MLAGAAALLDRKRVYVVAASGAETVHMRGLLRQQGIACTPCGPIRFVSIQSGLYSLRGLSEEHGAVFVDHYVYESPNVPARYLDELRMLQSVRPGLFH